MPILQFSLIIFFQSAGLPCMGWRFVLERKMADEAVIRKLVADGDGTNEDKRILQLISLIEALGTTEDPKMISNKILIALDQIEMSIKKQCLMSNVFENDTKNNEELFVNIDFFLEKEEERMEVVKKDLVTAKLVRKNRQEYDALVKLIKERPSRDETQNALKQLQVELDEDLERQKLLEQMLSEKRKNMYSLAILLNNLEEDTNEAVSNAMDDGE